MGYCMSLMEQNFRIRAAHHAAALQAGKAMSDPGVRFAWTVPAVLDNASSLNAFLDEWRWHPLFNETGDITKLDFTGEKLGDDKALFDALAPFVEPGSYLMMHGEDGAIWRWFFDGRRCIEQHSRPSFDSPCPEVSFDNIVDVEAREVVAESKQLPGPR